MAFQTAYRQSPNYSKGRPAGSPNVIVIHYWDDPARKPSFEGVVNWLCRAGGDSSAHYVVEAGRVTQLVSENDRAWHAGPAGNPRGIGVECNPRMSQADLETVAQLIANIRARLGNLPLKPHNAYANTSCPGAYANWLNWLSNRADQINKTGGAAPAPAPVTKTDGQLALDVDGIEGAATISRLQQVMGTPIDGELWKPSAAIEALQRFLNKVVGAAHIRNLTGKTALDEDGYRGVHTTSVFQFWSANAFSGHLRNIMGWTLTAQNFHLWVDGIWGANTTRMLQAILNDSYANSGKLGAK